MNCPDMLSGFGNIELLGIPRMNVDDQRMFLWSLVYAASVQRQHRYTDYEVLADNALKHFDERFNKDVDEESGELETAG